MSEGCAESLLTLCPFPTLQTLDLDEFLDTVDNVKEPIAVHSRNVAGVNVTLGIKRLFVGLGVVQVCPSKAQPKNKISIPTFLHLHFIR